MFTGFASENTPAIQVWDFSGTQTGTSRVSLSDDCAPVQYFKTGSSSTNINLYLPSCPIEGKQIRIINASFAANNQRISIRSSDLNGQGTNASIYTIGQGQTLDLCYSKSFISFGSTSGSLASGWISTNQAPIVAGNYSSVVIGGINNSATGNRAAVVSGADNFAQGSFSFIGSGDGNNVSGFYASIVGGQYNTNGADYSFVGGGQSNNTSQSYSSVVGGQVNTVSQQHSFIGGGFTNTVTATHGAIAGGAYGTTRGIVGYAVFPSCNAPIASTAGVSQSALLLLGRQTTDATATVLRSNTSAASTTNQVILPNNSAYTFQGTCIANVTGGGTTSGWKFEGVIKRGANAASTTLVAAVTPTVIAQDAGASTWVLAITADTTNGGIAVTVTGAAATTIRWVTKIETTEVTF
jgi:hypothetical protein